MNGPGDIPLTHTSGTPDTRPCSIISIIPTLGMSSCRGRAEAFARRLSSKLRTLGSQTDDDQISQEDEPIINGSSTNTWMTAHNDGEHTVTDLQPLRQESDSFFDFDCELESPGSPVDECEYLRLIETASNTPHNSAAESGYACASAASSHSSNDVPYLDTVNSETSISGNANHSAQQNQQQQQPQQQPQFPIKGNYVNVLEVNNENTRNTHLFNGLSNDHEHEYRDADDEDDGDHEENAKGQKRQMNHHGTTEESEQKHQSNQTEFESVSSGKSLNMQDTKPSTETGPDIRNNTNQSTEQKVRELTANEMAKVQDQIIKELQKECEQYSAASSSSSSSSSAVTVKAANVEIVASTDQVDCAANINNHTLSPLTSHKILNGHNDSGEEIVQIEVSESNDSKAIPEQLIEDAATTTNVPNSENNDSKTSIEDAEAALSAEKSTCDERNIQTQDQQSEEQQQQQLQEGTQKELRRTAAADTTDDEEDCRPQRVRRCSSLKTGKTPPGTPGRKKIVRFADVLGLDLADVKTFLDEIPTIPKSAFEDLEILESEPPIQLGPKSDKLLMPLFQQPGGLPTFLDLVREKQVSLENAAVTDHINQTITGSVRVRNLDFHKSVHIRYSIDNWRSFADLQANYVENSCDGFSDKFTFFLFCNTLQIGQRIEFAVRFQCKGQQFWDNNYGTNYCFQCLPTTSSATTQIAPIVTTSHHSNMVGLLSPTVGDAWCSSFY